MCRDEWLAMGAPSEKDLEEIEQRRLKQARRELKQEAKRKARDEEDLLRSRKKAFRKALRKKAKEELKQLQVII